MPRQSKSKTDVPETTTAVNTPVVNSSSEKAPKVAAAPKSKPKATATATAKSSSESSSSASAVAPTPVTAPAPVPAPAVEASAVEATDSDGIDIANQSAEFLTKLNQAGALFASLRAEFRTLEKKWSRELKTAQKSQVKRKRKSGNRQPSGFVKPTKISDELAKFLEKPVGTEMARTDVTREINSYIRAHNLQDTSNGRKIIPDAKLATLLKLNKTDELTYFNLQRYMSPHFFKAVKAPTATA
jgi:upstream activation factor subunit UAF30